jgi:glycosyltransferase involved in cell wall biosynthesis
VPQTLHFLGGLARCARAQGFDVHALSSPGADLNEFAAQNDVAVHALPMCRRITPLHDLKSLWGLRLMIRRLRPDVVHAHTPKAGLLTMLAAWLSRVPVRIYHIHGLPLMTARGLTRTVLRWTERVACRLAQQVLCVSHSVREVALAERLCPITKIKVLLNGTIGGVDAEHLFNPAVAPPDVRQEARARHGIPDDAFVVGFVGRIVRDKGIIELTHAWAKLREELSHVHLMLVGAVEAEDPLPGEVEFQLRGDPRVHWTGFLPLKSVPRVYPAMDLLVLPTYREGFNTVCLEAAAMELPVVGTSVPGVVDAVEPDVTGTLVPPHDPTALADAIRSYVCDPDRRRQHGLAGRRRVLRDYRPQDVNDALVGEYRQMLTERGMSPETDFASCLEQEGVALGAGNASEG